MRLNRCCYLIETEIKWMLGINSAVTLNTKKQEVAYDMVSIEEHSLKK